MRLETDGAGSRLFWLGAANPLTEQLSLPDPGRHSKFDRARKFLLTLLGSGRRRKKNTRPCFALGATCPYPGGRAAVVFPSGTSGSIRISSKYTRPSPVSDRVTYIVPESGTRR
jgi:hypothetical protein